MGWRFGRSTALRQMQSWLQVSAYRHGHVVEICLGSRPGSQGRDEVGHGFRKDTRTRTSYHSVANGSRQRVLRLSKGFGKGRNLSLFYPRDTIASTVHRTLKERMHLYFTSANTLRYETVLQSLVRKYNASRHSSIDMPRKRCHVGEGEYGMD